MWFLTHEESAVGLRCSNWKRNNNDLNTKKNSPASSFRKITSSRSAYTLTRAFLAHNKLSHIFLALTFTKSFNPPFVE